MITIPRQRMNPTDLLAAMRAPQTGPDMVGQGSPAGFGLNYRPPDDGGDGWGKTLLNAGAQVASAALMRPQQTNKAATVGSQPMATGKTTQPASDNGADFSRPRRVVWPDASSLLKGDDRYNLIGKLPFLANGGTLEPGDAAVVGDGGPELAVNQGGRTRVVPFDWSRANAALAQPQPESLMNAGARLSNEILQRSPDQSASQQPQPTASITRPRTIGPPASVLTNKPAPQPAAPTAPAQTAPMMPARRIGPDASVLSPAFVCPDNTATFR